MWRKPAASAARAMVRQADCRILVIAPVGLHDHWQGEAASLGLHLELHSWARLPDALPPAGTVLIADEAHFAQNGHTRRSQGLLRLARHGTNELFRKQKAAVGIG